ncbi:MAG TPA: O-antigen ligase family protein [Opitutaceae bacterium]|jgi:hypothetical protein
MSPRLRFALYVAAGCTLAVVAGVDIANEAYALVASLALFSLWLIVRKLSASPPDAWMLAAVVVGYVIGNRGFAQLQPAPGVPLLPAEALLLVAAPALVIRAAIGRTAAVRMDALNLSIIAWIVIGAIRLPRDMAEFGVMALRDYATVYYAALFFIAQEFGWEEASRSMLKSALSWSFLLLVPVVAMDIAFPEFLETHTVVRGVPLIFQKSDLVGTSLAAGFFWMWTRGQKGSRLWYAAAAASLLLIGPQQSPRAGMAGVAAVTLLWVCTGRWRIVLSEAGIIVCGAAAAIAFTVATSRDLKTSAPYSAYEHALSIFDPAGKGTYINEESGDPGGNNQFRLIWWRDVAEDTLATGPVLGQGFGADLATRFLADYNLLNDEAFAARSPHSVIMTVFGRMGFLGLAAWIAISWATASVVWKLLRAGDADALGLASIVTVIWVSSTVGVVLEGPMGAVPYWTALGLASAQAGRPRGPDK